MTMTGNEIRESFLKFFELKGHTRVASSSLIPKDDPTLLFTNSGMVQFKNLFLGKEDRGFSRAVTVQKSVRAGGKHNDLENVGVTARHHTFFEMLGNFSFGDYFKEEAIAWAWEYLTEVLKLSPDKLWVTIYKDDEEAFNIWHRKMDIPVARIIRMGEESNFWMMGDIGPCGPCSEILYDQGDGVGCGLDSCGAGCDCDRYLEIWNLVFTQFDRNQAGLMTPLPNPNIDTGMGLERLAAVLQGVKSNYDSDLFTPIIAVIESIAGRSYRKDINDDISIRVIADHSRAITFLIGDGILPTNEGRGYVLRRILRRAARHGRMLGLAKPFLYRVADQVISCLAATYPDLTHKADFIEKVIQNEEERFLETLDGGLNILQEEMRRLAVAGEKTISGPLVFKLYDTFGFPADLTADVVRREGFDIDKDGFDQAMALQREKSRESWKGSGEAAVAEQYQELAQAGIRSIFCGYEGTTAGRSEVIALMKDGLLREELLPGEEGEVFLEKTPFYGEIGGQSGDEGIMTGADSLFMVANTKRPLEEIISHLGRAEKGTIRVGDILDLQVDQTRRRAIEANHSATHLLQAALKSLLGNHVKQSGSLVAADRLRFDFTHFSKIEEADIRKLEEMVNGFIRMNLTVDTVVMPLDEAVKTGATAVFDEKYGDEVRVLQMGEVSRELCGGTHVRRTGDIGLFKILHEFAIAAGVRRIEAVTGAAAIGYLQAIEGELKHAAELLKTPPAELAQRVERLLKQQRDLERELEKSKGRLAAKDSADLVNQARVVNGIRVLAVRVDIQEPKELRDFGDKLRDRLQSGIILLGSANGDKANLLCLVTADLTGRYQAGRLIREIAPLVGGKGGGRDELAQAGGVRPEGLDAALEKIFELVK